MRATVGTALAIEGAARLAGPLGGWPSVGGGLGLLLGAALLSGCLTPVAALLTALLRLGLALSWLPSPTSDLFGGAPATIFLLVMTVAVLLLGPGAYSLDARLFGRREIIIP